MLCTLIFSEHGHFFVVETNSMGGFFGSTPIGPSKEAKAQTKEMMETMRKKRDLKGRYGKTVVRSLTDWVALVYVRIRKRASRRLLKGLFFEQSDVLFVCEVMCIFSELRNSKSMNLYVFVLKPLISFSC